MNSFGAYLSAEKGEQWVSRVQQQHSRMHSLACENYSMLARVAVAHGFSQLLLAFVNLAVFVQQHLSLSRQFATQRKQCKKAASDFFSVALRCTHQTDRWQIEYHIDLEQIRHEVGIFGKLSHFSASALV